MIHKSLPDIFLINGENIRHVKPKESWDSTCSLQALVKMLGRMFHNLQSILANTLKRIKQITFLCCDEKLYMILKLPKTSTRCDEILLFLIKSFPLSVP